MASQGSAWYVDFFRADYLNVYGHMFTDERAEKESAFVASALDLKPGAQVLDLCCGQGRHAVQLAKRGLKVTGLDLNPDYVELVLQSAAKALQAGGVLLLDMLNREWAIDNYIPNDWHTGTDGTLYVERRDLDLATSRMHVHFIVVDPKGGRRESIGHNIRLYTLTEMTRLLDRVGFQVTAVFGGFE